MKTKFFAIASFAVILWGCSGAEDKIKPAEDRETLDAVVNNEATAAFQFDKEFHDFGNIEEGTKVETVFTFENVGESPLIITSAKGSCGCTVPDYPHKPIPPGGTGEIKVSFDSTGRGGKQDKTVTLNANTVPNQTILKITSNVLAKNSES